MIHKFLISLCLVGCLFFKTAVADESPLIIPKNAISKHIAIPYILFTIDSLPTAFPEYNSQLDSSLQYAITTPVKAKTNFQIFMLGEHYQSIYLEKYQFATLDLATYKGGVEILKQGGGKQTNSLRLRDSDGHEYAMRSLTKDVFKSTPYPFNKMRLVTTLFRDNYLGTHPFAPLSIPTLADAVNVYHANPQIYYIPKQPVLGTFNENFGGEVYIVEERPSKKWPELASFGNAEKFTSTPDLAEKLVKNHNHTIDQNWVARSRIFDLLIGDFDRHDDQWRWTVTKGKGDNKIYRPVPRDRDQAYSKYDGFVVSILSPYNALLKQLADYDKPIDNYKWATYNSRHFDHTFLNELPLEEWLKEATFMQESLTDAVIEQAFSHFPDRVHELTAANIIKSLKTRRDQLPAIATSFYQQLAKKVAITGTAKKEYFEVVRLDDQQTLVKVYAFKKDGVRKKEPYYERLFKTKETKEIYLFGLDGADVFDISGQVHKGIALQVVGGEGEDQFIDESSVKGIRRTDRFYDSKIGNSFQLGKEGRNLTSKDTVLNTYNRLGNLYDENTFMPFPLIGVNADDGFLIGFSGIYTSNLFNKFPYGQKHKFGLNYASATQGLEFFYEGEFINASKSWDIVTSTEIRNNRYAFNHFGFGNETPQLIDEIEFYRVRQSLIYFDFGWQKRFAQNRGRFSIRPLIQGTKVDNTADRFISMEDNGIASDIFERKWHSGIKTNVELVHQDNPITPKDGYLVTGEFSWQANLDNTSDNFTTFGASITGYKSLDANQDFVLASRLGTQLIRGEFDFFFAPTLGQDENFRGLFSQRYRGETTFFHNTDLRVHCGNSDNPILPFSFGLTGSFDYGRVWSDVDDSDLWHTSYGGGFWFIPLNLAVISFNYNKSDEDSRLMIRVGHFF